MTACPLVIRIIADRFRGNKMKWILHHILDSTYAINYLTGHRLEFCIVSHTLRIHIYILIEKERIFPSKLIKESYVSHLSQSALS